MKLCRLALPDGSAGLGIEKDNAVYRLGTTGQPWRDIGDFLHWSIGRNDLVRQIDEALHDCIPMEEWPVLADPSKASGSTLLAPIDRQEVWAAGVTYLRSREAREEESKGSGIYDRVYEAERPELFFKATASRVSGPNQPIRIRADAHWNVPEPELALVINPALQIVGYTVGNDVSSRDIEGANPLYLPQAKVYRQCCALGPAVLLSDPGTGTPDFSIRAEIGRGGRTIWTGDIRTSQMKRSFAELVDYLGRENVFPDGVILMTGTGLVPPDTLTLEPGDVVTISIDGIGTLRNNVVRGQPGKLEA